MATTELFELLGWGDEPTPITETAFTEEMVARFGLSFPSSITFSRFIQDRPAVDASIATGHQPGSPLAGGCPARIACEP